MRLHLRLIAVVLVAAGLIGGLLAITVFDTDEGSRAPSSKASELPTPDPVPTGPTGPTALTGATGMSPTSAQPPRPVPQPVSGPLLGVNLTAYTRDGYGQPSVRKAIDTLADLGSTAVTLVPTWYMSSSQANRIAPDPDKSPSDSSLDRAISWSRQAGLQVILKPHVDVIDDSYRGEIRPANFDRWFRSYGDFIDHYATYASARSVDLFVAGTELKTVSTETDRWRSVIQLVRDRYRGPVTYAANWDEVDQVQFWDDLDAIGVDAYYELSPDDGSTPTLQSLVDAWKGVSAKLESTSESWQRPVLLTEVGFPSQTGATVKPYEVTDQPADQSIQALAYKATFKALSGSSWLRGISWWSWRADPSPEEDHETDYSPEGKQAQKALAAGQFTFMGG